MELNLSKGIHSRHSLFLAQYPYLTHTYTHLQDYFSLYHFPLSPLIQVTHQCYHQSK